MIRAKPWRDLLRSIREATMMMYRRSGDIFIGGTRSTFEERVFDRVAHRSSVELASS
jgi:hypothetical protein